MVLSKRNITILTRDRSAMTLMLAAAPAVGSLDLLLALVMGRTPFNFTGGDAANGAITLFLMTIYALLVGGMSQMREFVKESDIYKRERLVNLRILPYVMSKVWVALLLAFLAGIGVYRTALPGLQDACGSCDFCRNIFHPCVGSDDRHDARVARFGNCAQCRLSTADDDHVDRALDRVEWCARSDPSGRQFGCLHAVGIPGTAWNCWDGFGCSR